MKQLFKLNLFFLVTLFLGLLLFPNFSNAIVLEVQVGTNAGDGTWWEDSYQRFMADTGTSLFGYQANDPWGVTAKINSFQRFANITIPQGATINAAYMSVLCRDSNSAVTVNAKLDAIAADNASAPTTYSGAENATRTSASVSWNNVPAWTAGAWYNTPDISSIIQEIVGRSGWASGNAMVFYLEDNGSTASGDTTRDWYPFEVNNAANTAKLHIEYTTGVPPAETTPPSRSSGSPSGTLAAGTTQTTLSLSTNENATCKYGTASASYLSLPNTFSTTGSTSHSQTLTGLTNGTSYTYYVRCQDTAGNPNIDDYIISFSVANPVVDTTPPTRSNGLPMGTLSAGTTQTTLSLSTNESANCKYGTTPNISYTSLPNTFTTTGGTSHSQTLTGLANGTSYNYYIRCQDTSSNLNQNTDDYTITFSVALPTPPDTTPPAISNVQSSSITQTIATITWTTDDLSTSILNYGLTTSFGQTQSNTSLVTSHLISLSSLTASTTYYYQVRSCNSDNYCTNSTTYNFTTLAAPSGSAMTIGTLSLDSTIENISVISNFSGDNNANNFATIEYRVSGGTWKPGIGMTVDRRDLLYEYESGSLTNSFKNQWRAIIYNLTPNTTYEVRVIYTDADGGGGTVSGTITTRNDNPPSSGNTYYVSTTGNDTTGNGSQSSPWKTVQKAASSVSTGDTVRILPGTYSGLVNITKSGTINNYVTFISYDLNNKATLSYTGSPPNRGLFYLNNINYVRIKGLNITVDGDGAEGVYIHGNSVGNIVEDCNFQTGSSYSWWAGGIYVDGSGLSVGPSYTLIQRNTFTDTVSSDHAASGEGPNAIMLYTTSGGTVIRDNNMTGNWQDGVSGSNNFKVAGGPRFNSYIYRNTITGQYDDGIEAEGGGINCAVYNNYINVTGGNMDYADAPVIVGPMYVFRNVFVLNGYYTQSNIKLGSDSYGYTYFYHNTIYGAYAGNNIPCISSNGSNNVIQNMVFKNNIIQNASGGSHTVLGEWANTVNITYDYNDMYAPGSEATVEWHGVNYTWSGFKTASGQESHGVWGINNFANASGGNYNLLATDAAVDKGTILTGFNDSTSPWPYSGSAPDIGAYEYNSGTVTYPLGDLNKDGKVNIYDVSILLSKWASTNSTDLQLCDINAGPSNVSLNKIDLYDANKMMANWRP